VYAQPDFDHVVHGTVDQCTGGELARKLIYAPGASWEVLGLANTLENKLAPQKVRTVTVFIIFRVITSLLRPTS
jgi:hypothetical protein